MTIDKARRFTGSELLRSHWKPTAVAQKLRFHPVTAYRWERNLQTHGTPNPPCHSTIGPRRKLTSAAKEKLLEYQNRYL